MHVTAVIVSWNVRDHLTRCIDSLYGSQTLSPVRVIVVDNASSDGTPEHVRAHYPNVHLIANATNRGFAAAVNQGIAALHVAQAPSPADAILLLNPDAELLPGSLEALTAALEQHPEVAAVGPHIAGLDGHAQPTRRRFPTLATAFLESTIIQDHFPNVSHVQRFYYQDVPADTEQEVDWLVGACLLIRAIAVRHPERSEGSPLHDAAPPANNPTSVGGFDERFFVYFEELDWFLRAHRAGWRARYLPTASALHHGGASTSQVPQKAHLYFAQSKRAFYTKHYGPLAGAAVHAFSLISYLLRAIEDAVKLAFGHRRSLRRDRIALYLSVLRGSKSASS